MTNRDLRPDCANCASLCCIAFEFEKSESFAIDKKSGEPCPNLNSCGRCSIYDEREEFGFSGCVGFNCYGAGQRVTQDLFEGQNWQNDARLRAPMAHLLIAARRAHEALQLLHWVLDTGLPTKQQQQAAELAEKLEERIITEEEFLYLAGAAKKLLGSFRSNFFNQRGSR
ncbi:hypothetical protein DS901_15715 [Loktanella sp. D2R18]|uniref:hypothetical protein n=1 Tax=Rhodobacterales TaxID=204455 RepID=UPI000DEAC0A6|nr:MULTISPECIES: hypothetical protein [Rhodobacterales]MDO6591091.1 hypothetical protein [Yoonia sp. 1_MG-2023]RBW42159.1 hypothetical protein DS901_15715 [Loktanella sp. D2R18]